MRPHRIEICGFTCFTKQVEISFIGMDVFAITGRTGSGKTTIMDAMCYALYGRVPRGTDVSRLVAQGVPKMYVSLEFEAGGGIFRAFRGMNVSKTTLKSAPMVQLERRRDDGQWEPLENRVREMTSAVEQIVGLDYRSFTKCVLLPQGQFQEMLAGDREGRRKVLEDLLDMGVYKTIMERANRRARELDVEAKTTEQLLASTFADATEEELSKRQGELAESKPALKSAQQSRDALQQAALHISAWRTARTSEIAARAELDKKQRALTGAEALAAGGQAQLSTLREEMNSIEAALRGVHYDRAQHNALSGARAIAEQVERVAVQSAQAQTAAADAGALQAADAALHGARTAAANALKAHTDAERSLERGRDEHAAVHLRAGLKPGDTCPVCSGTVGKLPKIAEPALAALEKALVTARKAAEAANAKLTAAGQARALAEQKLDHAKQQAAALALDLVRVRKELATAVPRGVPAELPDITARLAELADQAALFDKLSQNVEASRTRCSEHERAVAASAQALAGLRAEAKTLADGADKSRTTGDEAIAELTKIVKRWSWGDVAESITAKRDPSALVSRMLDDAQKACDGLERRIGALEQEAKRIERDIKLAVEHRTRLVAVRAQASLHTLLADLLHANQFRDWYIGEAMALLAEAATLRLGSLDPDQRYALQVSKDGEFVIVDRWQAGAERSPETLSGGETFVVSLALALALAEQLPQIQSAAAASLDSLFLDEGFGTLDADTLEPVMTALQGLRLEGRLVGIVTHVTELSDRIGTRIEVTKAPEGSSITLVGAPGE